MDKNEYLKKWAEKLSLPIEQINSEFDRILLEEKEIHKDQPLDQQELRALKRLALVYKKQMRSPAVGFEGIIIGTGDSIDALAKKRREALALFNEDPQSAITQGITDEAGNPLDTREEWSEGRPNQNYGKPLAEHNFLKNVWVVAKQSNTENEPKLYQMLLTGEKAKNEDIPVLKPVRFMAIDKETKLNASQFTNFVVDEKIQLPEVKKIVEEFIEVVSFGQLEDYHKKNKDDFNRLVCVTGDVSVLNLEPTSMGSRIMHMEDADASLEDLDAKGLTCWLPSRINVDFAEGSKVIVIGRTSQGKKKDENGNLTEQLADVTMNVFGVYALPEFKIELPEDIKPITEENSGI